MKVIVFVFVTCVLIILSQESEMQDYKLCLNKQYKQACIAENSIEPDRIKLIERNELTEKHMTKTDKCYISCMLLKNRVMTDNWTLNITKFTKAFKSAKTLESTKKFITIHTSKNSHYKNDCAYGAQMFFNVILMLESKNIRFTVIYKGSDVPTEHSSCGQY